MSTSSKLRHVGKWRLYLRHDAEAEVSTVASLRAIAREVGKHCIAAAQSRHTFELIVDIVAGAGLVETGRAHSLAQSIYKYTEQCCNAVSFVFVGITQPPNMLLGRDIWFPPNYTASDVKEHTDPRVHMIVYPPTGRRFRAVQ